MQKIKNISIIVLLFVIATKDLPMNFFFFYRKRFFLTLLTAIFFILPSYAMDEWYLEGMDVETRAAILEAILGENEFGEEEKGRQDRVFAEQLVQQIQEENNRRNGQSMHGINVTAVPVTSVQGQAPGTNGLYISNQSEQKEDEEYDSVDFATYLAGLNKELREGQKNRGEWWDLLVSTDYQDMKAVEWHILAKGSAGRFAALPETIIYHIFFNFNKDESIETCISNWCKISQLNHFFNKLVRKSIPSLLVYQIKELQKFKNKEFFSEQIEEKKRRQIIHILNSSKNPNIISVHGNAKKPLYAQVLANDEPDIFATMLKNKLALDCTAKQYKQSPLMWILEKMMESNSQYIRWKSMANLLLKYNKLDVNAELMVEEDCDMVTRYLHLVEGNFDLIKFLLDKGANPLLTNSIDGYFTPRQYYEMRDDMIFDPKSKKLLQDGEEKWKEIRKEEGRKERMEMMHLNNDQWIDLNRHTFSPLLSAILNENWGEIEQLIKNPSELQKHKDFRHAPLFQLFLAMQKYEKNRDILEKINKIADKLVDGNLTTESPYFNLFKDASVVITYLKSRIDDTNDFYKSAIWKNVTDLDKASKNNDEKGAEENFKEIQNSRKNIKMFLEEKVKVEGRETTLFYCLIGLPKALIHLLEKAQDINLQDISHYEEIYNDYYYQHNHYYPNNKINPNQELLDFFAAKKSEFNQSFSDNNAMQTDAASNPASDHDNNNPNKRKDQDSGDDQIRKRSKQ